MKIKLLKSTPHAIPAIAEIFYQQIGKIWTPDISIQEIESWYYDELAGGGTSGQTTIGTGRLGSDTLPITFVAFDDQTPIGMCSLREDDDIRPDLFPWLASLAVHHKYQNHGIGRMLVTSVMNEAKRRNFKDLYLYIYNETLIEYYSKFGCHKIADDKFKNNKVTVMQCVLQ